MGVEDAAAAAETAPSCNGTSTNVSRGVLNDAAIRTLAEVLPPPSTQLYSEQSKDMVLSTGERTGEILSLDDLLTTNRGYQSMDDNSDGADSRRSHPRICFHEIAIPADTNNHNDNDVNNSIEDDMSCTSAMDMSEDSINGGGQRTRVRTQGEVTQGEVEDDDDLEFTRRVWEAKTGIVRAPVTAVTPPSTVDETQHRTAPLHHVVPPREENTEIRETIGLSGPNDESSGLEGSCNAYSNAHSTSTQNPPPTQQSQSSSSASSSSSSIMAVAHQISETVIDQERALFMLEVRNEITSTIAHAEQVDNSQIDLSEDHTKFRSIRMWFLLALSIVGLIIVISVVVSLRQHDNSAPSSPLQSSTPMMMQTVAPTPTPIVYLDDGRRAFTTTPQLYDAVDSYHELLVMNPSGLNTSDIAITYGYPIGTWDVSRISDFSRIFDLDRDRTLDQGGQPMKENLFNEDLSGWDTSNAITMAGMFAGAREFTGIGLSTWNVTNVRDFSLLFKYATAFNGNISNWDTSRATTMDGMFSEAHSFDGDLSLFNVSQVESMAFMFNMALSYTGGDLTRWDVSNVRRMHGMFIKAGKFQGNISTWDTTNVREMQDMFAGAYYFHGDISSWSVGNVENMARMFSNSIAMTDVNLSRWDTSRVTDMSGMFVKSPIFNGDVSLWDTSRVETFENMFEGCTSFDSDISRWNTSSATLMKSMFGDASSFAGDVSMWDTRQVKNMNGMFARASSFNSDISRWNVSGLADASYMLTGASKFNQNLCSWMDQLRPDAIVTEMFKWTACINISDPVAQIGPFCSNCDIK